MPERDYGLGGREARGAYESAKASVASGNSEKDGSSLAPSTSSRPRARPDNVASVGRDDNKSSAPSTSSRPRARPKDVKPLPVYDVEKEEASTISIARDLDSLPLKDAKGKTVGSVNLAKNQWSVFKDLYTTDEGLYKNLDISYKNKMKDAIPIGPLVYEKTPSGTKGLTFNTGIGKIYMDGDVDLLDPSTNASANIGFVIGEGYAEGGKVSDEAQLEMELIMNEQVDPVSGNTAPIGAKPEEVRDDVEIRVSPGEYVINAQTVRYFGEDFFDELQKAAAEGFERIKEGEELPFRDDELDIEDDETEEVEPEGFAYGGRVKGYAEGDLVVPQPVGGGYGQYGGTGSIFMGYQSKTFINDETGQKIIIFFFNGRPLSRIPSGFREMGETPAEEQEIAKEEEKAVESDKGRDPMDEDRGWRGKSVDTWDMDDFKAYRDDMKNTPNAGKLGLVEKGIIGLVGSLIAGPLGGLALQKLAEKANLKQAENVTNVMNGLLSSGKNLDGNALTDTEMNDIFSISYEANVVNANLNPTGQTKGVSIYDQPFYSDGQGGLDIGALTPPTPDFSSISITPEEQAAADAAMAKAGKGYTTTSSSSKTSSSSSGKNSSGGNKDPYSDNNNAQSGGGSSGGGSSGSGSSGKSTGQQAADTYSAGDVYGGEFGSGKSAEQEASESMGSYFNKGGLVSRP